MDINPYPLFYQYQMKFQKLFVVRKIVKLVKCNPLLSYVLIHLLFMFLKSFYSDFASPQHLAIISTTHYTSDNSVVVLMNAHRRYDSLHPYVCISSNGTNQKISYALTLHAFEPINVCKWTAFTSKCDVIENMKEFKLSMHSDIVNNAVLLPYRKAYNIKSKVISCFSPLFYNERWQLMLATLEIFKELGVDKQVFYIQSMVYDVYRVLDAYKKEGYAEIEPWAKINLGKEYNLGFDVNQELDWRNQASAHTDCFLKYKDAAEFILVGDIDDILFPKMGKNYYEEFVYFSKMYPSAAGFIYDRYNTEVTASVTPQNFKLDSLLDSSRVYNEWEDGKYVVNTSRVDTAWLHWPGRMKHGYKMQLIPDEKNVMLHFRKWKIKDVTINEKKNDKNIKDRKNNFYKTQIYDVISPKRVMKIESNWRKNYAKIKELEYLPVKMNYYSLIANCYNQIFYNVGKTPTSCPGPVRCNISDIPGLKCMVSHSKHFKTHFTSNNIIIHYLNEIFIQEKDNGCTL
uniref:Glycosyltransferase family 92 protein n=1 Tax=Parastrongyloides trichosuri TaxID=131310 RepID=A0A0N4ZBU0_PARTI